MVKWQRPRAVRLLFLLCTVGAVGSAAAFVPHNEHLSPPSSTLSCDAHNDPTEDRLLNVRRTTIVPSPLTRLQATKQEPSSSIEMTRMCRRDVLSKIALSFVATSAMPSAAFAKPETIGKDPNCNDSGCLGVWDGLLADCPHGGGMLFGGTNGGGAGPGCVSSQDDTPGTFAEPWDYSETATLDWEEQSKRLLPAIERVTARRKGDSVRLIFRQGRYARVVFQDGTTGEESVGEFYYTPDDTTIQFRLGVAAASSRSTPSLMLSYKNMERSEEIRKELGYLKLPVLRNRKRTLVFGESVLDTFGPRDASMGPPENMADSEWNQRADVDPKLKIDFLQQFPF